MALIALAIVLVIFVRVLILKKHTGITIIDKFVISPFTISKRLIYYVIYALLCIALPYILTIIFIIVSGDRYEGMSYAVIPCLASVNIFFGLIFINNGLLKKILLIIIIVSISLAIVWLCVTNNIINTGLDIYGFWDLPITNFLIGLIIWETYFQLNLRFDKITN